MATTTTAFLVRYPEFAKANAAMLTAALADAELMTSDAFGDKRDLAVYLQLADALATGPSGRDAQLSTPNEPSTYRRQYDRLARALACGNSTRLGTVYDGTLDACDD